MKFGTVQTKYAAGGILAHSLVCGRDRFRKGKVLDEKDIRQLIEFGYDEVVVARLEDNDTEENLAAAKVAENIHFLAEPENFKISISHKYDTTIGNRSRNEQISLYYYILELFSYPC